ncbi:MAG TPA: hypothetical protein VHF58_02045 [Solirubrobacterales bacterium]|nr:hypothetical protein [Solirubrobacterales bacterium]
MTGVLFIVVLIVGFVLMGDGTDAEEPVEEIVAFYADNKDEIQIGAFVGVLAGLLLMAFGAYLRSFLRRAVGEDSILPSLAFIGTVIVALSLAIDSTISFALAESADNIDPAAVQALQALWDSDFIPFILGIITFLLGAGLAILRSDVLPKWLGGLMILALIIGFTPIGWAAGLVAAVSILILSVLLTMRARSAPAAG